MAAPPRRGMFECGFRFTPSPKEVVTYYLPRLISNTPLPKSVSPFIHLADIYAFEPGVLAGQFPPLPKTGSRFFFATVKRQRQQKVGKKEVRYVRAAGPGSWSSQGSSTVIEDGAGVKVGEMRKLRYKKGGEFTDWLMEEYSCCLKDAVVGDMESVLCKIYVSPKAAPDSAARQESAAFFVVTPQAAAKRQAATDAEPRCPKRMRVAVVAGLAATPPVVVQPAGCTTTSFAPSRPCVPCRGIAPSSIPSVTRPPPSSALPPAPLQTRPLVQPERRAMAFAPPRPRAPPHQQRAPLPTPSGVRVCYMPEQAAARHRPPEPLFRTTPVARGTCSPVRARDPFDVPTATDEEEEEAVAAPDDLPSTAAPLTDDDLIAFADSLLDMVPAYEAE